MLVVRCMIMSIMLRAISRAMVATSIGPPVSSRRSRYFSAQIGTVWRNSFRPDLRHFRRRKYLDLATRTKTDERFVDELFKECHCMRSTGMCTESPQVSDDQLKRAKRSSACANCAGLERSVKPRKYFGHWVTLESRLRCPRIGVILIGSTNLFSKRSYTSLRRRTGGSDWRIGNPRQKIREMRCQAVSLPLAQVKLLGPAPAADQPPEPEQAALGRAELNYHLGLLSAGQAAANERSQLPGHRQQIGKSAALSVASQRLPL